MILRVAPWKAWSSPKNTINICISRSAWHPWRDPYCDINLKWLNGNSSSKIYEFIELPFNFHEFLFQSWLFRKFYKYYKFKQGFHDDKSLNLRCFRSKTIPTVGVSGCPSEVPLGVKSRTLDLGESPENPMGEISCSYLSYIMGFCI